MKKKLMAYIMVVLIFVLIFVSVLFYAISNYEKEQRTREELTIYNHFFQSDFYPENNSKTKELIQELKNIGVRVTVIDVDGVVIFDSTHDVKSLSNHNNREEIIDARKDGEGYVIRHSISQGKTNMYFSTVLQNGNILRTSKEISSIYSINSSYMILYILAGMIILVISFWLSSKLSYIIVKPIRDLDNITSMIAKGDFGRRVRVTSNDELGKLASNFNFMADKLENSLNELKEKQNRLSAILESMESGVIAIDNTDKVIMINNYAKNLFNITNDVVGNNIQNICKEINFNKVLSTSDEEVQEVKLVTPMYKVLKFRTADIIINSNQHIGAVTVINDITEVKKLENMRTEFVANVSHELKTPLTSIRGFTETLKYVDDDDTRIKFLNIIEEETERLTRLINDILILSNIEQSKEVRNEYFYVDKIIESVYDLVQNQAKNKNIEINLSLNSNRGIFADPDRFKQMIINLVDNAIKYNNEGGKVFISTKNLDKNIEIVVEDTGIGIKKDYIDRLFERFYRVDKARSRVKGGTGLGLAIVKHIVLDMHGSINVDSTLGKGTKFIIKI